MKTNFLLFVLMLGVESMFAQGGVPLWTNRFDGPGLDYAEAIAVDDSGNTIVAGYSYSPLGADPTHSDYLTVAYSNGGQLLWSNRYHGPEYGDNGARAVASGKDGRVFVTGDAGTIAYSNSGVPLWTNRSAPAVAIALDDNGNVFTTGSLYGGSGFSDWITVALSPDGGSLWTNRTGLVYDDFAKSVAVDCDGNVLVAGSWTWPTGLYDFTVVKYSGVGIPLWTNHFDARWDDFLAGMAVSEDGTVFLTGNSANSGIMNASVYDFLTVAFSGNGTLLWTNRYDGPANAADFPVAIRVDGDGNVIVLGSSAGDANGSDNTMIKYSPTGAPLWTNRSRLFGSINSPTPLAVDKDNNVVVTGSTYLEGYTAYATVLYSSAGVPRWTNVYSGPVPSGNAFGQAVTIDAYGNVFVTGYSSAATGPDFVTIKYASSLEPYLRIENVENQAVLTWYTPGFSLQSAPFATGTFTNISSASSPYTNPVTSPQQFFRLIAN